MGFDYGTLITDRTAADVARVQTLAAKNYAAMTDAEKAEWDADMKGAYNASDLNRVNAALEDLKTQLEGAGYAVEGYARVEIDRNASRLPEGYTEVEYIQSSGTQYVDTGFVPNQDTRVYASVEFLVSTSVNWLFGARTGAESNEFGFLTVGNYYRTDYGSKQYSFGTAIAYESEFVVDFNKNIVTLDFKNTGTLASATFAAPVNMVLFGVNTNGTITKSAGAKLYSCQIYDNGTLVRDYIPCIDPSGAVGLYDVVGGQFYANAGTGVFTAGAEVTSSDTGTDLDPYTWYETDTPTASEMSAYLANVAAVRRVLTVLSTTPTTPASMADLTVDKANDIEKILLDISVQLDILPTTYIPCGEAICGGDNL